MAIADRARCAPWELDDVPAYWVERVRLALVSENKAQQAQQRRADRQRQGGRQKGLR